MAKLVIGTSKSVVVPAVVKEVAVPVRKYSFLERIKDDSNNEIGTVCGFHTDANGVEYAVVCLDARYRQDSGLKWMSTRVEVTGLPLVGQNDVWGCLDTAASNCSILNNFATSQGYSVPALASCQAASFVIENVSYSGLLPTANELLMIATNITNINSKDTSASQYSSQIIRVDVSYWSSTQKDFQYAWAFAFSSGLYGRDKQGMSFIAPILELPNALS